GAAADRFGLGGVDDAVGDADVDVADPVRAAVGADRDVHVAFRRLAVGDRLVVDVAVVRGAVGVERDRRIGALRLRFAGRQREFGERGAGVGAGDATLVAAALVDRQPDRAVRRNVQMTVQAAALLRAG